MKIKIIYPVIVMLRRVLLISIILLGIPVFAAENYLNSVVLSGDDGNPNIILRTDNLAKVKKSSEATDKILITLKGVKQSGDITTLYKDIPNVNGFIIQNEGNDLKIYVEAPNISKSDIIFETPNSSPIKAVDKRTGEKFLWSIISGVLLLGIIFFAGRNDYRKNEDINKIIKEREIAIYRNFQKEVSALPADNSYKLKGYRKHVLKGETIRSYESRFANIHKS